MSEQARSRCAPSNPTAKRWLLVLLASVLFHWTVIEWANGNLLFPLASPSSETLVTARLQQAAPVARRPKASPPQKKKPKLRSKRPAAPPPAAPIAPLPEPAPSAPSTAPELPDTAPPLAASDAGERVEVIAAESEPTAATAPSTSDTGPTLSLPPSAELKYDVHAQKKGFSYYGTGIIAWQADGSRYLISGKAKVAFFTVLEFRSEGEIDKSGIAPILYAERAGNKAETNTHFHRERNTISFSASTLSYPRIGGEQDRASIIWQLAALGRGNPELFKPGEELRIFVAGVRNAAPWRIYILGEEEVEIDGSAMRSWHVKSVPQQGGYEKTFDIWYASGYEWYPVKLKQTEFNGDYLELSLSNLLLAHQ